MHEKMPDSEVTGKIFVFLDEFAGLARDTINIDTSLFLSGRLSSADAIDLFMFLDEAFGIKTDMINIDLAAWDTVGLIKDKISHTELVR
ncbi:MAG: acyl carrier protein [Rhodospirillales bacterium]